MIKLTLRGKKKETNLRKIKIKLQPKLNPGSKKN